MRDFWGEGSGRGQSNIKGAILAEGKSHTGTKIVLLSK